MGLYTYDITLERIATPQNRRTSTQDDHPLIPQPLPCRRWMWRRTQCPATSMSSRSILTSSSALQHEINCVSYVQCNGTDDGSTVYLVTFGPPHSRPTKSVYTLRGCYLDLGYLAEGSSKKQSHAIRVEKERDQYLRIRICVIMILPS